MSEMRRTLPDVWHEEPLRPSPCPDCKGQGGYQWRAQTAGGGGHASGWSKCDSCKGTGLHPELQAAEIAARVNKKACQAAIQYEGERLGRELNHAVARIRRVALVTRWILLISTLGVCIGHPSIRDLLGLHWMFCFQGATSSYPLELVHYVYIPVAVFTLLRMMAWRDLGLRGVTSTSLGVSAVAMVALWVVTSVEGMLQSGLFCVLLKAVRWLYFMLCRIIPFLVIPVLLHDILKGALWCITGPICWIMKKVAEMKCRFVVARILRERKLSPGEL